MSDQVAVWQGRPEVAGAPPSICDGGRALFDWTSTMRETHPVWRDARGMLHVFRYDDVQRVVSDFEVFSSDRSMFMPDGDEFARGNLTMMDPPRHRELRRFVSQAFTPSMTSSLAPRIATLAKELLTGTAADFDFVDQVAQPLPVIVIAELLGVPTSDRDQFGRWAEGMLAIQAGDLANADLARAVQDGMRELHEYMIAQCRTRRRAPTEDLLSELVRAEIDGAGLDDDEAARMGTLLLLAGHITSTMMLGSLVLTLHEHPAIDAELRRDPTLVPAAVQEVLRYRSPFMQTGRLVMADTTIGAEAVSKGAYINAWLLSANHDKNHFSDPEKFDVHRDQGRHAAFGHGIHFCVGASLARLEGQIVLSVLHELFSEIRVADSDAVRFFDNGTTFGVKRLPVSVRRRA